MPSLKLIEQFARKNYIPVMLDDTKELLFDTVAKCQPKRILEIGTAIGYSGIVMLSACETATLNTIELLETSANMARENFREAGVIDRVTIFLYHRVDALVLSAGVSYTGLLTDMTDAEWHTVMDVNVSGAFYLIRALAPGMVSQRSGSIVTVSSMWGRVGASCEAAYSASKAALIGLTRALAKELGPSGVRANCIAPGVIDTKMMDEHSEETKAILAEETPLGRLGTPQDVAAAAKFLLSDEAAFITGQVLGVDGGYL